MPVSPARAAAFDILLRVERNQSYASELLHSANFAALTPNDHGLATELVMGVLRWRSLLDSRIAHASSQKLDRLDDEVLCALRVGAYQILLLPRVPARAAIFEGVELTKRARKRSAAPFVNAVLRKVSADAPASRLPLMEQAADTDELAEASAHPAWLVARWVERYGLPAARKICAHDQAVPATAISMPDSDLADELSASGVTVSPGLLLRGAGRVESGNLTKTAAYREGRVSIQDEASQLVALLVGHGERILDCCAAPGSKASLIARRNPQVKMVAAELHPHRARLLRALVKQENVIVMAADARNLPFGAAFDRILADVPCSGTGTLARNPEIKWRITLADLHDLQSRQVAILKCSLASLVPGGRLVYSTCSLEHEENEAVLEAVMSSSSEFRLLDCREQLNRLRDGLTWSDTESLLAGPCLRTIPGVHPCDGFFAAMIKRKTS